MYQRELSVSFYSLWFIVENMRSFRQALSPLDYIYVLSLCTHKERGKISSYGLSGNFDRVQSDVVKGKGFLFCEEIYIILQTSLFLFLTA
jgi:hypothetical protein